ncbi:MAG: hypothetical protein EZS28_034645, partial [Streblomastix strix]
MQKANALFSAIQESRSCETKQDLANQLTIHLYRISQIELESFVSKQVCMAMKEQLGDFGLTEEKAMLDNNQLEYEIMNGVKSLRALAYASEWPSNRDYFAQE